MSAATVLDQATTMIERAWAQPIEELETLVLQRPVQEPLLRSAMHIRSALVVSSNAAVVHQDRLHAMAESGQYRPSTTWNGSPGRRWICGSPKPKAKPA